MTLDLIKACKITNYNTKHTKHTRTYFHWSFFLFFVVHNFQKKTFKKSSFYADSHGTIEKLYNSIIIIVSIYFYMLWAT